MNAHVLLIEDDSAVREVLHGILKTQGYHVSETGTRVSALEKLRTDPTISVVILDLGLPPATHNISEGIATLRAIQGKLLRVKVIVLTGLFQENAALEAIREGAFDFLQKPATPKAVLHSVTRALLFLQKEGELGEEGITRITLNAQISDGFKGVRTDAEKQLVQQILRDTGFNIYRSAKRLGVKRENMYYFLKKYGIARD